MYTISKNDLSQEFKTDLTSYNELIYYTTWTMKYKTSSQKAQRIIPRKKVFKGAAKLDTEGRFVT